MSHSRRRSWAGSDERRAIMHMALDAVPNDLRYAVSQRWIKAEGDHGKGRLHLRRILVCGPDPDFEVVTEVQVTTRYNEPLGQVLEASTLLQKPHPPGVDSTNFPMSPLKAFGKLSRKGYILRPLLGFRGIDKATEDLAKIGLCPALPHELLAWVHSPLVHTAGMKMELAAIGQDWNDDGRRKFVTVETRHMQVCLVPEDDAGKIVILALHEKDANEPELD